MTTMWKSTLTFLILLACSSAQDLLEDLLGDLDDHCEEWPFIDEVQGQAWTPNATRLVTEDLGNGAYAVIAADAKEKSESGVAVATSGGIIVTDSGVIVVESMVNSFLACQVRRLVEEVAPGMDVEYLLVTSAHGDHSWGTDVFQARWPNLQVVLSQNAHDDIVDEADQAAESAFLRQNLGNNAGIDEKTAGLKKAYENVITFGHDGEPNVGTITLGGHHVDVLYFGFTQTDGDFYYYHRESDTIWTGNPVIAEDPAMPWMLIGHVNQVKDGMMALYDFISDDTTVVPGHGFPTNKTTIGYVNKYLETLTSKVTKSVDIGLTFEQTCIYAGMEDLTGPKNGIPLADYTMLGMHYAVNIPWAFVEAGGEAETPNGLVNKDNMSMFGLVCQAGACRFGFSPECCAENINCLTSSDDCKCTECEDGFELLDGICVTPQQARTIALTSGAEDLCKDWPLIDEVQGQAWTPNATRLVTKDLGNGAYAVIASDAKERSETGVASATSGGIIVTDDGVIVIESMVNSFLACQVKNLVEEVAPGKDVEYLLVTSAHGDHSWGTDVFQARWPQLEVVLSENAHDEIVDESAQVAESAFLRANLGNNAGIDEKTAGLKLAYEGATTFGTEGAPVVGTVTLGGHNIDILSFGFTQTDGDFYYFHRESDTVWTGNPVIAEDPAMPWMLIGRVDDVKTGMLALYDFIDDDTTVVPGHGYPTNKVTIGYVNEYLETLTSKVTQSVDIGLTFEQTCIYAGMEDLTGPKNGIPLADYTMLGMHYAVNIPWAFVEAGGEAETPNGVVNKDNMSMFGLVCQAGACRFGFSPECCAENINCVTSSDDCKCTECEEDFTLLEGICVTPEQAKMIASKGDDTQVDEMCKDWPFIDEVPGQAWTPNATRLVAKDLGNGAYAVIASDAKEKSESGVAVATSGGIIVTDDGVIVIESMVNSFLACQVRNLVEEVAPGMDVEYLLVTSAHGDHSWGTDVFQARWPGLQVVISQNAHDEIVDEAAQEAESAFLRQNLGNNAGIDEKTAGLKKAYENVITFGHDGEPNVGTITLGGHHVDILYFGFTQTDGDFYYHDRESDTIWTGNPVIAEDPAMPWMLIGHVNEVKEGMLALYNFISDDTTVVPGHGYPTNRATIGYVNNYLETLTSKVTESVDIGLTFEQTCIYAGMEDLTGPKNGIPLADYTMLGMHYAVNIPWTFVEAGGEAETPNGVVNKDNMSMFGLVCQAGACRFGFSEECCAENINCVTSSDDCKCTECETGFELVEGICVTPRQAQMIESNKACSHPLCAPEDLDVTTLEYKPWAPGTFVGMIPGEVDPFTGASKFILRVTPQYVGGWHFHTSSYEGVILSGSKTHVVWGEDRTTATPLVTGDYWHSQGGHVHRDDLVVDEDLIMYLSFYEGPLDGFEYDDSVPDPHSHTPKHNSKKKFWKGIVIGVAGCVVLLVLGLSSRCVYKKCCGGRSSEHRESLMQKDVEFGKMTAGKIQTAV